MDGGEQKLVLDAMVIQKEGTSFLGAGKARKGGGDEDVSDEVSICVLLLSPVHEYSSAIKACA